MSDRIGGRMQNFQAVRFPVTQLGASPEPMVPGMVPGLTGLPEAVFTVPAPVTEGVHTIDDRPVLTAAGVTEGLGMEATEAMAFRKFMTGILDSDNEAILRQQLVAYAREQKFDPDLRRVLLSRALRYYKSSGTARGNAVRVRQAVRGATPDRKPMASEMNKAEFVVDGEFLSKAAPIPEFTLDLEKAEPRGGKYHARVQHQDGSGNFRYYYDEEKFKRSKHAPVMGAIALKDRIRKDLMDHVGEDGCNPRDLKFDDARFPETQVNDLIKEMTANGQLVWAGDKLRKPPEAVTVRPGIFRTSLA